MPADALRRFTPTPFKATFAPDGVNVVVSTNLQLLLHRLQNAWGSTGSQRAGCSGFDWRLVVEADDHLPPESVSIQHVSHDGLALLTIAQNCFLACDLETREGIGFIQQRLVSDDDLFQRNLLPALMALMQESADTPLPGRC
jgi:hypothetical protein